MVKENYNQAVSSLKNYRTQLLSEMKEIQNKVEVIDDALKLLSGTKTSIAPPKRRGQKRERVEQEKRNQSKSKRKKAPVKRTWTPEMREQARQRALRVKPWEHASKKRSR